MGNRIEERPKLEDERIEWARSRLIRARMIAP
jgi:hypothetical protein